MAEESSLNDAEIEACLAEIAEARQRLGSMLSRLRSDHVLNPLDWREWFREDPWKYTAAAATAGFLLSGVTSRPADGRPGVLDDFTRAGLDTVFQLFLKTLI